MSEHWRRAVQRPSQLDSLFHLDQVVLHYPAIGTVGAADDDIAEKNVTSDGSSAVRVVLLSRNAGPRFP